MKLLETLATLGPGRRAPVTVVEMVLQAEPGEASRLATIVNQLRDDLLLKLTSLGLEPDQERWRAIPARPEGMARLAGFACQTALALQRKAGHTVEFEYFLEDKDPLTKRQRFRFIFEHNDPLTGELAGDLAMRIISESCSDLKWTAEFHDATEPLDSSIEAMLVPARGLLHPRMFST